MNSPKFYLAGKAIGLDTQPYCIAEVGINHNGNLEFAKKLIDIAKKSGADAVKFQTFKADEFCGDPNQMYSYKSMGQNVTEPMQEMFRRYELSVDEWREIKAHCDYQNITFLSTPQNNTDLDLLLGLNISAIKVGSDDFTNIPLLKSFSASGLPIILSCGMADLGEIYNSLSAIGSLDGYPTALLLCNSQYPTPLADLNLNRLQTLRASFPMLVIGFSDHTIGPLASSLAVGLGARILEKHFTLSHNLPGPDHWFSEEPGGLVEWVTQIQNTYTALGSGIVRPTASEIYSRQAFRRVIVASKDIHLNEVLSDSNMTMRRIGKGSGLSPSMFSFLIGRKAIKHFRKGDPIEL